MPIIDPDEIAFEQKRKETIAKNEEAYTSDQVEQLAASILADFKTTLRLRKDQIKNDVLGKLRKGYRVQITEEMKELGMAEEILGLSVNFGLNERFISLLGRD